MIKRRGAKFTWMWRKQLMFSWQWLKQTVDQWNVPKIGKAEWPHKRKETEAPPQNTTGRGTAPKKAHELQNTHEQPRVVHEWKCQTDGGVVKCWQTDEPLKIGRLAEEAKFSWMWRKQLMLSWKWLRQTVTLRNDPKIERGKTRHENTPEKKRKELGIPSQKKGQGYGPKIDCRHEKWEMWEMWEML